MMAAKGMVKLGSMAWREMKGKMNMKKTVNFSDFCDAFVSANRDDSFSYEGKKALFDYFEELERDCGEEIELDVIAFCCEYSEYESVQEVMDQYQIIKADLGLELVHDDDEVIEALEEYLRDRTQVVCCKADCVLIADY